MSNGTINFMPDEIKRAREVLGISEKSTIREIKSAYRNLWYKHHPDTGKADNDKDNAQFTEMKHAYDTIINYCENYEISFSPEKTRSKEYDHMTRFYDGWIGDFKKK